MYTKSRIQIIKLSLGTETSMCVCACSRALQMRDMLIFAVKPSNYCFIINFSLIKGKETLDTCWNPAVLRPAVFHGAYTGSDKSSRCDKHDLSDKKR